MDVGKTGEKRFGAKVLNSVKSDLYTNPDKGAREHASDMSDSSESDSGSGLHSAASSILEAIQDNDAGALASALKLAWGHCQDEGDTGENADDDD